jgi:hypothetical protein
MVVVFLEYDFFVIYKLGCSHFGVDALSWLPDTTKNLGVPNQTTNVSYCSLFGCNKLRITFPLEKLSNKVLSRTKEKKIVLKACLFPSFTTSCTNRDHIKHWDGACSKIIFQLCCKKCIKEWEVAISL